MAGFKRGHTGASMVRERRGRSFRGHEQPVPGSVEARAREVASMTGRPFREVLGLMEAGR